MRPLLSSSLELKMGWLERAWQQLGQIQGFNPYDRTVAIKVVSSKIYIIAHNSVDGLGMGVLVKAWVRDLIRMLGYLVENRQVADFEGLFTCSARAGDIARLLPGIPIFSHCYRPPLLNGSGDALIVPLPRSYSVFFFPDPPPLGPASAGDEQVRKALLSKAPKAVFRGALSGPARLALFIAAKALDPHGELTDVGMTEVPRGMPCPFDPWTWCGNGPRDWAKQHGLVMADKLSLARQLSYRYQIITDGVGCADRLGTNRQQLFSGGAVLLWARTDNAEFWYSDLKPWVHYAPLAPDFSDLLRVVRKLNSDFELVVRLATAARDYAAAFLRRVTWLAYTDALLAEYSAFVDYSVTVPSCAVRVELAPLGADAALR